MKAVKIGAVLLSTMLWAGMNLSGQSRGRGRVSGGTEPAPPGSERSNAPAGTPAASADRDSGADRAADVGNGKKNGLSKTNKKHKNGRTKTTAHGGEKPDGK